MQVYTITIVLRCVRLCLDSLFTSIFTPCIHIRLDSTRLWEETETEEWKGRGKEAVDREEVLVYKRA